MVAPLLLWSVALSGFGASLGLYFSAALWFARQRVPANAYLSAFCACFAALMIGDIALLSSVGPGTAWTGNVLDWVFLLLAPLFYFYVRSLTTGQPVRRVLLIGALLPAAICLVWFVVQMIAVQASSAGGPLPPDEDFMPAGYTYLFVGMALAQLLFFCVAANRLINAHARQIAQTYSSIRNIDLRWLRALMASVALAALVWTIGIVLHYPAWTLLNAALPPILLLFLGVAAQRQQPLPSGIQPPPSALPDAAGKYAKSGLTEQRMSEIGTQLAGFMQSDKAFLESGLTLDEMATRSGVPSHQLSQVLNQHLGVSFFEYVNRMRVEEAKRCLRDPAFGEQTVLQIGFSSGFNSKAAFNAAFKRFTGTTPAAYRSQVS
jgi:AraC-like DNA-binding protein